MKIINCPKCGRAEGPADSDSDVCRICAENKPGWTAYIGPSIIVCVIAAVLASVVLTAYVNSTRPYPAEVIGVSLYHNHGPQYRIHLHDPRWCAFIDREWRQDVPEGVYRTFNAGDHWPTDYDRSTMQRRVIQPERKDP